MKRICKTFGSLGLTLAAMAAMAPSAPAAVFDCSVALDNFNRANSGTLGPNWTVASGGLGIQNNKATQLSGSIPLSVWNGAVAKQEACADVSASGTNLQYAALVLGYKDAQNNIFIKVQDNVPSGTFNQAFFYYGNNGECEVVGDACSAPIQPFTAARLHAEYDPATRRATLDIDTDFDNVPEQSITRIYVPQIAPGSSIGLGMHGIALADNFATAAPPPAPPAPVIVHVPVPVPAAAPSKAAPKKPLKCKKGFRKQKVKGKVRCVKRPKKRAKK